MNMIWNVNLDLLVKLKYKYNNIKKLYFIEHLHIFWMMIFYVGLFSY